MSHPTHAWEIWPGDELPWEAVPGISTSDARESSHAIKHGGLILYRAPETSEVAAYNTAAFAAWRRQWEKMRRAKPSRAVSASQRERRALGLLYWWCFNGNPKGMPALAHRLPETGRDELVKDLLRALAPLVNEGVLSRNSLRDAVVKASQQCGHVPGNKSLTQLDRDIDRALAKFTEPFDWDRLDESFSRAGQPGSGINAEVSRDDVSRGDVDDESEAKTAFEFRVEDELDKLRIRHEARQRFDIEQRPAIQFPPIKSLTALLAEPDTSTRYRIDKVAPEAARVLLSAQFKAGKTTLVGNQMRSLADGEPFLGQFAVHTQARGIVLIDDEMSENTMRRWLRDQGIVNTAAVADVITLRGRVPAFNLLDDRCHAQWVARLVDIGCDYLILDCLRPVLDALGLDENRDTGRFLVAFDGLLAGAGIDSATVVHHMGHANERARGDSRLQDWPDAIWRLVREADEPSSPRFFSAYGRDVDVHEGRLSFDPVTRRLTYAAGSRTDAKTEAAKLAVVELLVGSEPLSGRQIEGELGSAHPQKAIRDGIAQAVKDDLLTVTTGAHRSKLHGIKYPCSVCAKPVASRRASHESCAREVSS